MIFTARALLYHNALVKCFQGEGGRAAFHCRRAVNEIGVIIFDSYQRNPLLSKLLWKLMNTIATGHMFI